MTDIDRLKAIMVSQDINIDDERFTRAFRIFENPAGCPDCGARTRVGVIQTTGKNKGKTMTACCKKLA